VSDSFGAVDLAKNSGDELGEDGVDDGVVVSRWLFGVDFVSGAMELDGSDGLPLQQENVSYIAVSFVVCLLCVFILICLFHFAGRS
jgi:hypothetical protein